MADLDALGDADGWTCWLCGLEVPRRAKANDPAQPVTDQIAPGVKGTKGRGVLRLAHKRCNDLRKGRPPSIPWPERFEVADAPELVSSLARLDKAKYGDGEVVAMCGDPVSAQQAADWVVPVAAVLFPGEWQASCEPLARMTAVRLVKR